MCVYECMYAYMSHTCTYTMYECEVVIRIIAIIHSRQVLISRLYIPVQCRNVCGIISERKVISSPRPCTCKDGVVRAVIKLSDIIDNIYTQSGYHRVQYC